ncbi:MAG: DUF2207 domain-containing protein [Mogibacterium sp.]|nr:DUF2207 domain-containing protein [Mogibacterium sp.]
MKKAKTRELGIRISAVIGILVVMLGMTPFGVWETSAADNTMYATDYEVNVDVHENNSYDFEEILNIYYVTPHHGIYRYIPKNGSKISNISVPGYEYDTYTDDGNIVIKIGSGDYTLVGDNEYKISYRISLYDDENAEKDMLLINLIPTDWDTDIGRAHGLVKLPKDTDLSKVKVYSGVYGTEGNEDNVQIKTDEAARTIAYSVTDLPAHHGITIAAELPQGYWVGAPEFGKLSPFMMLLALLGPIGAVILWWLYGRDDHMVKTLEFYPPEDLSPGELGYIIDGRTDKEDIVSTIVYLADKGYMGIEEGKGDSFTFTALKEPGSEVPAYIKTIYDGIFNSGKRDKAQSDKLGTKFGKKYQTATEQLSDMFKGSKSIIKPESKMARLIAALSSIMPIYAFSAWQRSYGSDTAGFAFGWAAVHVLLAIWLTCSVHDRIRSDSKIKTVLKVLGVIWLFNMGLSILIFDFDAVMNSRIKFMIMTALLLLGTMTSTFFAVIAVARTSRYTEILGKTLGFRDFIKTAELDKIKALVEEDPEYFFHIIPYAYVFGLTNKWIKKFENIPVTQPVWYSGTPRYGYFDGYYMGRIMHNCSSSVADNIVIPAPRSYGGGSGGGSYSGGSSWSGGGGFSGGGFSGGGTGGGGGGGW